MGCGSSLAADPASPRFTALGVQPPEVDPAVGPLIASLRAASGSDGAILRLCRGPTDTSNWLLPGRVLVGSCPGSHVFGATEEGGAKRVNSKGVVLAELRVLRTAGVTHFFNFQQRLEERKVRPHYTACLRQLTSEEANEPELPRLPGPAVFRAPIVDGGTWSDRELLRIVDAVQSAMFSHLKAPGIIDDGDSDGPPPSVPVLYLHCYGGHGRAGVVASVLLWRLSGGGSGGSSGAQAMTGEECMELVQRCHDTRLINSIGGPDDSARRPPQKSPTSPVQVKQVLRICGGK